MGGFATLVDVRPDEGDGGLAAAGRDTRPSCRPFVCVLCTFKVELLPVSPSALRFTPLEPDTPEDEAEVMGPVFSPVISASRSEI